MKSILLLLLEADYSRPITIKEIAKKLNVSSRTILRDMPSIEEWLNQNKISFIKKPGVGLLLGENLESKNKLKRFLEQQSVPKDYSPEERKYVIIAELLQIKEPIKLYYFSNLLGVAEGTLSSDLDKVEEWFQNYNIKLIRRPGFGIYVEGKETDFRKAMVNLLYENLDEGQLLQIIKDNVGNTSNSKGRIEINARNRLLSLIDKNTIENLEKLVYAAEKKMNLQLADSAYVGLIVHLALALQRLKNNEKITINKDLLEELRATQEYNMAKHLAKDISVLFDLEIPEDEIGYITMHLKGAKLRIDNKEEERLIIGKFELIKVAKEMIRIAEEETGYALQHNEKVLLGLVNHLGPAISRLKMNLDIRNPLLSKIKENYPTIYKISEKSAQVLKEFLNVEIPESEIGYIALHLGAAIENEREKEQRLYRVAVVCASGIGTSRLLAARLEKEFKNIQVVDIISSIHLDDKLLREKNIELIISTIEMESSIKTVYVNPLLLDEDKTKIEQALKELKEVTEKTEDMQEKKNFKDVLVLIEEYTKASIELLNNLSFYEKILVNDIEGLITKVAQIYADSDEQQKILEYELKRRERLGSTILNNKGIILLHCRSESIKKLQLGFVCLDKGIDYMFMGNRKERIDIAIIMLAPANCSKAYLEVVSEISRALIEKPDFVEAIKDCDKEQICIQISNIIEGFYYEKMNLLRGRKNEYEHTN
ncbi:BglG family transcription antiterminator [Fonticella tunisiensis]|nr:PRD domain-containing protein [Fonticella tunisiensis]